MTPADLRLVGLGITALLYGALATRLALAGRWPWFFVYACLGFLKEVWWLAEHWQGSTFAFYSWVEPVVMIAKALAVLEGLWMAGREMPQKARMLLVTFALGAPVFILLWGLLPLAYHTEFAVANRNRLAAHGVLLFWLVSGMMDGAISRHIVVLACYVGYYVAAGVSDYWIFALPHGPERLRRFYVELAWFLPLRAACLAAWLRSKD